MKQSLLLALIFCSIVSIQAQTNPSDHSEKHNLGLSNHLKVTVIKSAGEETKLHNLKLKSTILDEEREIYISLPPNYNQNTQSYPVVLVLDGEFLFDITRSMTTLWTARNYMPESIIIGLPNMTNDKRFDLALKVTGANGSVYYRGGGNPKKYLNFFKNELLPFIEKNYRANSHRTIIGLSPTSGTVYQAFFQGPQLFTSFITINGGISSFLESGKTIGQKINESKNKHSNSILYLGQSEHPNKEVQNKRALIHKDLFKKMENSISRIKIDDFENESGYGAVIPGLTNGFKLIYPREDWLANYSEFRSSQNPAKALKTYYDKLSKQYGYIILPLETGFNTVSNMDHSARILLRVKKIQEAEDFVLLGLNYYPNSAKLYYRLAQVYQQKKDLKSAIINLKKAISLAEIHTKKDLEFYRNTLDDLLNIAKDK